MFLLDRDKADEVQSFLDATPSEKLHVSEFSFYSIGIFLLRGKMPEKFVEMAEDLFVRGGYQLVRLGPGDMQKLAKASQEFNLSFDDAYQYAVAEKYDLVLVSLDAHFDNTRRGRKTPSDLAGGRKSK